MHLLVVNGALHGADGHTAAALRICAPDAEIVHLDSTSPLDGVLQQLAAADALLVGTGVYWDSCGHPLQRLIEAMTPLECTPAILGKPVGVVVTCEAVGGKSVLNRLQGVFSSMGFLIPPLSGVVLSRVAHVAAHYGRSAEDAGFGGLDDLWTTADLPVLMHNLRAAAGLRADFQGWSVDRDPHPRWPLP